MPLVLKTSAFVTALGVLFALLPQQASANDSYYCRQELQYCLSIGVDRDICRDEYYYCRYGYYPVRSGATAAAPIRRD